MTRISLEDIPKGIKKKWYKNPSRLSINQEIVEQAVLNLTLTKCPLCKNNLVSGDNSGNGRGLGYNPLSIEQYCRKDNVAVELSIHPYLDGTKGTQVYMKIYSDSRNSKLVAHSGLLADIKGTMIEHIS